MVFIFWNLNQIGQKTMILLRWNSFTVISFTSYGKAMNYWQRDLLTFFVIRNTRSLIENLHIGALLLFHIISQIIRLFFTQGSTVNSFNSLQSSKLSSNSNFSTSVTSAPVISTSQLSFCRSKFYS